MWLLIFIVPFLIWVDYHIFKGLFRIIFDDAEDFQNSLKYSFTPDLFSLFRGEYFKDRFAEFKLGIFIFLCGLTIAIEVMILNAIF
jgi:MFS-type transporter involved in bile tolerance (Atg22 family)